MKNTTSFNTAETLSGKKKGKLTTYEDVVLTIPTMDATGRSVYTVWEEAMIKGDGRRALVLAPVGYCKNTDHFVTPVKTIPGFSKPLRGPIINGLTVFPIEPPLHLPTSEPSAASGGREMNVSPFEAAPSADKHMDEPEAVDGDWDFPPDQEREVKIADLCKLVEMAASAWAVKVPKGHVLANKEEIAKGDFDESILTEMRKYKKNLAIYVIQKGEMPLDFNKAIPMRFVLTWKLKGNCRVPKARLVVMGHRDSTVIKTFSGTPDPGLIRAAIIYALSNSFACAKSDVSTAFLQAPIDVGKKVYVKLPTEIPAVVTEEILKYMPGAIASANNGLYGLKWSPRVYTMWFKSKVKKFGLKEASESILVRRDPSGEIDAILIMYVDDLWAWGKDPMGILYAIRKEVDMDPPELLSDGALHNYV
uniref:Reverse transcriptase Ty1/copia-type domain-containing protein n=1 Tax=Chromera velia CCMP2878 TaxID=1169474 RepID=A0A0G4G8V0_9ALVE|eukprot:Cvel_20698.t1-p1 / transcript=Cvel_20698.t1 / gene=Cvel_20698 / organism=Chromera_velia_CCMP2878 / gene_product=Retrovirus-related Pol polyprotein from transposon, putative / transcript_product=Retrovirus-related Pol polyprotein from transposon, putative / location=Cvel_scaffold1883:17074-19728(-) / protein_length=419 / sequence_SO=supercontig / SO=protein_coding / is_pseudo=false